MKSNASSVDVWHACLADLKPDLERFVSMLSPDERARAKRFRLDADRARFVAARGMLRTLLGDALGVVPAAVPLAYGPHGKPYLESTPLHFSLAHSAGRIVVAMGTRFPLGIDVEKIRRDIDHNRLARRFFSEREARELSTLSPGERLHAFFSVWVRKEAFVKAVGRGIAFGLDRFSVTAMPGVPPKIEEINDEGETVSAQRAWSLVDLDVGDGYVSALCTQGEGPRVVCRRYTP